MDCIKSGKKKWWSGRRTFQAKGPHEQSRNDVLCVTERRADVAGETKGKRGEGWGECGRRWRQNPDHAGHLMELAFYSRKKGIPLKGFT